MDTVNVHQPGYLVKIMLGKHLIKNRAKLSQVLYSYNKG